MQNDLALAIQDAQIHGAGVQIDTAVVIMRLGIEFHGGLSFARCDHTLTQLDGSSTTKPASRGRGLNEYQSAGADA